MRFVSRVEQDRQVGSPGNYTLCRSDARKGSWWRAWAERFSEVASRCSGLMTGCTIGADRKQCQRYSLENRRWRDGGLPPSCEGLRGAEARSQTVRVTLTERDAPRRSCRPPAARRTRSKWSPDFRRYHRRTTTRRALGRGTPATRSSRCCSCFERLGFSPEVAAALDRMCRGTI